MNKYYIVYADGYSTFVMSMNESTARFEAINRYPGTIRECRLII